MQTNQQQQHAVSIIEDYMYQNGYRLIFNDQIENCAQIFTRNNNEAVIFSDDIIEYKRQRQSDNPHIINVLFRWETVASYKCFDFTEFKLMMLLDLMGAIKISEVNKQLRLRIVTENCVQQINELNIGNPVVDRNCAMV